MHLKKSLLVVIALLALNGCIKTTEIHGNDIRIEDADTLKPGVNTAEEVLRRLGSPSTVSTFGQETWYYIASKHSYIAFLQPKVVDQLVVAISFDQGGTLQKVEHYTKADMQKLQFAKDETPTPGNKTTILQQLLGNIGRFNPGPSNQIGHTDPTNIPY